MDTLEARRSRLREIKARMSELGGQAARNFWEHGMLFTEVKAQELWRDDGAATFHAWLEGLGYDRETARKAIHVAAQFSAEAAQRYGQEKLFAAVALLDATTRQERPGPGGRVSAAMHTSRACPCSCAVLFS